jgi:hypothetical protein
MVNNITVKRCKMSVVVWQADVEGIMAYDNGANMEDNLQMLIFSGVESRQCAAWCHGKDMLTDSGAVPFSSLHVCP